MKSRNDATVLFVNPVERMSVQGRHKQTYMIAMENGSVVPSKGMNKAKEFNTTSEYYFGLDPSNPNRLATGFEELIENPVYEFDPQDVMSTYGLSSKWHEVIDKVVKQKRIKKQTWLEIQANVDPDFYTSEYKGGTIFGAGPGAKLMNKSELNFLQNFSIVLYPRPNRFTTETARGRLAIELIKRHHKIANSIDEVNTSVHDWYISEENEAEERSNRRKRLIREANYYLHDILLNETYYRQYQIATVLKDRNNDSLIKGEVSQDKVETALNEFLDVNNPRLMDNVAQFKGVAELLKSVEGTERFEMEYLISQAINVNVMNYVDGYITWFSQSNNPNVYKFTDYNKLVGFLVKEYRNYNPEDDEITNWYQVLAEEVKLKGGWIDDN